jgi:hypothetical protein
MESKLSKPGEPSAISGVSVECEVIKKSFTVIRVWLYKLDELKWGVFNRQECVAVFAEEKDAHDFATGRNADAFRNSCTGKQTTLS